MEQHPLSQFAGSFPSILRDTLHRRTIWRLQDQSQGPDAGFRVFVPSHPGWPQVLFVLLISLGVLVGIGFMCRSIMPQGPNTGVVDILRLVFFFIAAPIAVLFGMLGMWHHVLFIHYPESRRPDVIRFDAGLRVLHLPRLGKSFKLSECRVLQLVTRPDPAGISNNSDAPRQEIRLVHALGDGTTEEALAVPYGHDLQRLGKAISQRLGLPLEPVKGEPWQLTERSSEP